MRDDTRFRLRSAIASGRLVRAVGCHDALAARLAENAGFEAIWESGLTLSASRGVPDMGCVTMSEYLDTAESLVQAVDLPVIADCDTGFGGPLNVEHMVRRYEARGIAAVCIEDKVFPKANSFADVEHPLVSIPAFVDKIDAGKSAQRDKDFLLIARTEALISGLGMDEAMERANCYAEAGADLVLVHSRSSIPEEIVRFARHWNRATPLVAIPTTYTTITETELRSLGFRVVIYANQTLRAQVKATRRMLDTLANGGCAASVEDDLVDIADIFELSSMPVKTFSDGSAT
jgi:phosphoenolpyruvate phosphomutase